ncbi:MAG TPA: serine hydrolase domain-containing protein [Candidatus Binatia bacterium]|nr:serine hydrolase domain-containing protein [Candidatus Binatia bacterium]
MPSNRSIVSFALCRFLLLAVLSPTTPAAAALPVEVVCPEPHLALVGTAGDDKLKAGGDARCILGDEGNDKVKGGKRSDILDPGPGIDKAIGGGGDDIIVVRGACEVGDREVIKGGRGTDTLRSPLTLSELEALGVKVRTIEIFELTTVGGEGACVSTEEGALCTCCDKTGFDADTGCNACADGFLLSNPRNGDGDFDDGRLPEPACIELPACEDLACGTRGTCEATARGATCACDRGYAGPSCEACAPHYERSADGRCVLGLACGEELCGGHGTCVATPDDVICQCDDGFTAEDDCGGDDLLISGPSSVDAGDGPFTYRLRRQNGAHCTVPYQWELEGAGTLTPSSADPTGSTATYRPPTTTGGRVDVVTIHAECGNNAALDTRFDVSVETPRPDEPTDNGGGDIQGLCSEALEGIDEAMLEWLDQQDIEGGTIAVTYQEKVVCLRAYGRASFNAANGVERDMRTCTPMRVASVSKPFTRAALRGNLFGTIIPAQLGGGTLGENMPILPILSPTMGLGPLGQVQWQAPAALYGASHPVNLGLGIPCNSGDGLINPYWSQVTVNNMLAHTAGFAPNQNYAFSPTTGGCTGNMGEVCGTFGGVNDPTVSTSPQITMANSLQLDHGLLDIDDIVTWMAGVCPYDTPAAGRFRYSNVGLTVAGKVVEAISGQDYESFLVDFLKDDEIIDLSGYGNPVVYLGQSKGGGPKSYALPDHMPEADYYTWRGNMTDVTAPVLDDTTWTYPDSVPAAYGGTNFDIMGPHGGLVMNALALARFGSEYLIKDGTPRDADRGGAGSNVYFPTDTGISHGGLLFGTSALAWEVPTTEPANATNPNGAGCLIPDDKTDADDPNGNNNGLDALDVEPCPLPPGIRVSVMFNGEQRAGSDPLFIRGRHAWGLLSHMLRRALSQAGTTAEDWETIQPIEGKDLRLGCSYSCTLERGCAPIDCGDGFVDPNEQCDDGDLDDDDACRNDCRKPLDVPAGYEDCAGEDPGNCLGGPCAPRQEKGPIDDTDRLDPYSAVHPDGDFSPGTYCHDSHTQLAPPWDEATCVRTTVLGKDFGVCQECGVQTMIGCTCPAPNAEDGGCNIDGVSTGLSCVGGRCWESLPPSWMCTADCDDDIYGTGGFCHHDDPKGAVCYHLFCDEPVTTYCAETFGQVCDVDVDGCNDDSCCEPECLDEQDCDDKGYEAGHLCIQERCVLQ